jgi:nitrate reductase NapD
MAALAQLADLELHAADESGKMVITLESDTEAVILERLEQISSLEGVLAANLVYHHSEDAASLEEEIPHENHSP